MNSTWCRACFESATHLKFLIRLHDRLLPLRLRVCTSANSIELLFPFGFLRLRSLSFWIANLQVKVWDTCEERRLATEKSNWWFQNKGKSNFRFCWTILFEKFFWHTKKEFHSSRHKLILRLGCLGRLTGFSSHFVSASFKWMKKVCF